MLQLHLSDQKFNCQLVPLISETWWYSPSWAGPLHPAGTASRSRYQTGPWPSPGCGTWSSAGSAPPGSGTWRGSPTGNAASKWNKVKCLINDYIAGSVVNYGIHSLSLRQWYDGQLFSKVPKIHIPWRCGWLLKDFLIQCYRLSFQIHVSNQIFRLPFQSRRGISWAPPLPEHAQTHWQCWGSPCSGCIHSTRYRGSSSLKNIRHHAFCHSIVNHNKSGWPVHQCLL